MLNSRSREEEFIYVLFWDEPFASAVLLINHDYEAYFLTKSNTAEYGPGQTFSNSQDVNGGNKRALVQRGNLVFMHDVRKLL